MTDVFTWILQSLQNVWSSLLSIRIFVYIVVLKILQVYFVPVIRKLRGH